MTMTLNLSNASTIKLYSINKNAIPKNFSSLIPHLEYVAKYNEGKFSSDKQKAAAFKKLFEVIHVNK